MAEPTISAPAATSPVLAEWVQRVWAGDGSSTVGGPGLPGWLATTLPCSFQYGGRLSDEMVPSWSRQTSVREVGDRTIYTVTVTDPATGLTVIWEATVYADFPAVEWLVTFRNDGSVDSPVLENVRALDLVVATDYHDLMVYHATGGIAAPDAFEPQQTVLYRPQMSRAPGATGRAGETQFRQAPTGGRSSNGVLPYFNVEANWEGSRGLVVAIGWSGQWEALVSRFGSQPMLPDQPDLRGPNPGVGAFRELDRVRLAAGMSETHVSLAPGEEARTPRILLIAWDQDRWRGQNMLRRFIYRHVVPTLGGQKPLPSLFGNIGIADPSGGALAAGYSFEELAGLAARIGVDYVVLDAGWYTVPTDGKYPPDRAWVYGVGNYTVRQDIFPHGLRPLADAVRREGKQFGLWFEPERVFEGTQVYREHRDWLLETPLGHGFVFNLGRPNARKWLTDTISQLIEELGIGWYRHDANANYLPAWRANDAPNRQGMTEIRYMEGLYQFWQDLLDRHPALHIDGCASGGRRMDFEALRHHHSQTHTDWLWGDPAGMQSILHGGNQWLPSTYFTCWLGTPAAPTADAAEPKYGFFSAVGGGMNIGWRMLNTCAAIDAELGHRWLAEYRALRHLTVGDFYPLLPHTMSEGEWLASQYHRPDLAEGMVVGFRRRFCPVAAIVVQLRGLDPGAIYDLTFQSTGAQVERSGPELARGLEIFLNDAPAHEIIRYKLQQKNG